MIPYHYLKTALKKKGCEPLKKALNEWMHIREDDNEVVSLWSNVKNIS